ncbi:MAG TPA: MmcQ/YjbR family DNA-binding protein [Thermoanaerobaculia bacterium]
MKKKPSASQAGPVTYDTVREIALALPGVEEGPCYGTPGLRVRGKLFARLWEDGETLVLKVGFDAREVLMAAQPEVFFLTDHYVGYPYVLVRLPRVERERIEPLIEEAWRLSAPKRLVAEQEAGGRGKLDT